MRYYFAPMEGITGAIYRRTWLAHFGGADKLFMPFLSPSQNGRFGRKELAELEQEAGNGLAVPQLLVNRAENFIWAARDLQSMGFREINLNLGCPSGTVFPKHKGAGALADPDGLDRMLGTIFSALPDAHISVKTRLGVSDEAEFNGLLRIYNRYPICELTVHARVREDYYRNPVRLDAFRAALGEIKAPVCYNGDLFSAEAVKRFESAVPSVDRLMIGRGLLADPGLLLQLRGARESQVQTIRLFMEDLFERYSESYGSGTAALKKMKELWFYTGKLFLDPDGLLKRIFRSKTGPEYQTAAECVFTQLLPARRESICF